MHSSACWRLFAALYPDRTRDLGPALLRPRRLVRQGSREVQTTRNTRKSGRLCLCALADPRLEEPLFEGQVQHGRVLMRLVPLDSVAR